MSAKPPTRDELLAWDRDHYWHSFTQMAEYQPLIFERAEGCTLYDIDGRAYLDGVSSMWCNVHGHRHPRIDAAIRAQLDAVAHVTSLGASNPTTIKLARRLAELAPAGLEHVFFSSDGASAVEVALKIAFQFWQQTSPAQPQKQRFVAFGEAYHGDTLGAVSVGGVERFTATFRPLLFDALRLPMPDAAHPPAGVPSSQALQHYLNAVETLLQTRHAEIAAVVIEPLLQGAAGIVLHPPGFLRGLRELTEKYNVLLIADEVAVGVGRTGKMFACDHEGVSPDLLCLGKGLSGGYLPLAATLASERVYQAFLGSYDEFKTLFHGHTYSGNPLAAAAALATLDVFEEEQTLARLTPKVKRLAEWLESLRGHRHVGGIRQLGLMAGIELVADRETGREYPIEERRGYRVCDHARQHGVWLRPLGNVVVVMPPLSIKLEELDRIIDAVEQGIDAATQDELQ